MKTLIWLSYCLSSAFDAGTTIYGARMGREVNPILSNGHGGVSVPRLAILDGAGCAGAVVLRKRKRAYWLFVPATAAKTAIAVHNLEVIRKESK